VAYNVQDKIQNYTFKNKCKVDHSKLIQTAEKREKAERNKEKNERKRCDDVRNGFVSKECFLSTQKLQDFCIRTPQNF